MEIRSASGYHPERPAQNAPKAVTRSPKATTTNAPKPDTCESSFQKPFGEQMICADKDTLSFHGELPSMGELKLYEPDESEKDGIDWESIERYVSHIDITLDNADDLQRSVHHMASMYLAAKASLQHQYSDREDILSEKMSRLDDLLAKAKSRLTSSYQSSVGSFYEQQGNPGAAAELGKAFSSAFDERMKEMEELANEKGLLDNKENFSYTLATVSLEIMSLDHWILSPDAEPSSLKDMEAAGFVAKAATKMNVSEWGLMSDSELGIHLALQYLKMAHTFNHWGISEKMTDLLLGSFETYLGQQSGNILTNSKSASEPWQYMLKQYEKTGDIKKTFTDSARRYLDDGFFSDLITASNQGGMSHSTRYQLSLSRFLNSLEQGNPADILQSIVGNGVWSMSAYA